MTTAELHQILDDENKKITLKEYQEILYQLKSDAIDKQVKYIRRGRGNDPEISRYNGEMRGFRLALDLSEHIKEIKNEN